MSTTALWLFGYSDRKVSKASKPSYLDIGDAVISPRSDVDDAKENSLMYQIQVGSFHLGLFYHAIFIQNGMSKILHYKFLILRKKEDFTFLCPSVPFLLFLCLMLISARS